jgi:hypothetical protein
MAQYVSTAAGQKGHHTIRDVLHATQSLQEGGRGRRRGCDKTSTVRQTCFTLLMFQTIQTELYEGPLTG